MIRKRIHILFNYSNATLLNENLNPKHEKLQAKEKGIRNRGTVRKKVGIDLIVRSIPVRYSIGSNT